MFPDDEITTVRGLGGETELTEADMLDLEDSDVSGLLVIMDPFQSAPAYTGPERRKSVRIPVHGLAVRIINKA